jgi:hypothetical protein
LRSHDFNPLAYILLFVWKERSRQNYPNLLCRQNPENLFIQIDPILSYPPREKTGVPESTRKLGQKIAPSKEKIPGSHGPFTARTERPPQPLAKDLQREPLAKVVEWFDLQENIEEDSLFPILRLKPPGISPSCCHPAKAEIQRSTNGKTGGKLRGNAINRNVPDLGSAFAGMTKRGIALRPEPLQNHPKRSTRLCRRLPHTFARGSRGKEKNPA